MKYLLLLSLIANNDLKVQQELAWFTLALVLVSFLQFVALVWQACLFFRQARIMGQHKISLEQLAKAAADNAEAASKNAEFSKQNALATEKSADAAKASADAVQRNIELVINKERARIRIVKPEQLSLVVGNFVAVEFKLLFYGTTPAFEVQPKVNCILSESRDTFTPFIPHGIYELPSVVSSSDIKPSYRDFMMKPIPLDEEALDKIKKSEMFVHFAGTIKYNDFMEVPRETAFHYRWNVPDTSPNAMRRYIFPEGWEEVGGGKENYYT